MVAVRSPRDAGEVLVSAMVDADAILQRLKQNIAEGRFTAADLSALGDWIDRAARISKVLIDAKFDERRVRIAEATGAQLAEVVRRILERLELSSQQQALVTVVVPEEFRRAAAGATVRGELA